MKYHYLQPKYMELEVSDIRQAHKYDNVFSQR